MRAPSLSAQGVAQGLDPAALLKPQATDTWPTYNGDYSGKRFSPLDQINAGNVNSLTLAWIYKTHGQAIKATSLEVNGILYFTVPDIFTRSTRASGCRSGILSGKLLAITSVIAAVAMYMDKLYFVTSDAHLLCLTAKDGKVVWDIILADDKLGYFATMAPLVVRDHIIAGVSGDSTDIRGVLTSVDPDTGKIQWRWYTEPDPGEPGSETWPDADALLHGGGMTWMTGTYDPDLNLLYWGTGNPNPVLVGDRRAGDNLYTCSIVALNPDTGKLQWAFQPSPHDVHDWDAVQTPILLDEVYKGKTAQAAGAGQPQRLLFPARSQDGRASRHERIHRSNLGERRRCEGTPHREARSNAESRRRARRTRFRWRNQLDVAEFRSADRIDLCNGAAHLQRVLPHRRRTS